MSLMFVSSIIICMFKLKLGQKSIKGGVIWGRAAEANNPTHISLILSSILKIPYLLWHQLLLQRPIWSSYQRYIQYLFQSGMWVLPRFTFNAPATTWYMMSLGIQELHSSLYSQREQKTEGWTEDAPMRMETGDRLFLNPSSRWSLHTLDWNVVFIQTYRAALTMQDYDTIPYRWLETQVYGDKPLPGQHLIRWFGLLQEQKPS